MSKSFKLFPTHFSQVGENPLVTGLLATPMLVCRKKFVPYHLKIGIISSVLSPF